LPLFATVLLWTDFFDSGRLVHLVHSPKSSSPTRTIHEKFPAVWPDWGAFHLKVARLLHPKLAKRYSEDATLKVILSEMQRVKPSCRYGIGYAIPQT
jgi:hypothetical protein